MTLFFFIWPLFRGHGRNLYKNLVFFFFWLIWRYKKDIFKLTDLQVVPSWIGCCFCCCLNLKKCIKEWTLYCIYFGKDLANRNIKPVLYLTAVGLIINCETQQGSTMQLGIQIRFPIGSEKYSSSFRRKPKKFEKKLPVVYCSKWQINWEVSSIFVASYLPK